jgi:hypothetical protein
MSAGGYETYSCPEMWCPGKVFIDINNPNKGFQVSKLYIAKVT